MDGDDLNLSRDQREIRRLKDIIHQQSVVNQELSSKKKRKRVEPDDPEAQPGRGFRRVSSMFDDIRDIALGAVQHELEQETADPEEDEQAAQAIATLRALPETMLTAKEKDELAKFELDFALKLNNERSANAWIALGKLVPNIAREMDPETKTDSQIKKYLQALQNAANDARSEDIRKVTLFVGQYLNKGQQRGCAPLGVSRLQPARGLENPTTGPLLISIEAGKYEEARQGILNGTDSLGKSMYFAVLYPRGQGNPQRLEDQMLTSGILIGAYKTIFTSPTSANDENPRDEENEENVEPGGLRRRLNKGGSKSSQATQRTNADRMRMRNIVTPRSIAYIAVLTHFALTDRRNWNSSNCIYMDLNYRVFYNFIVDFFEQAKTELAQRRVNKLLLWWQRQIYPDAVKVVEQSTGPDSSWAKLAAQRAAEARAEEERIAAEQAEKEAEAADAVARAAADAAEAQAQADQASRDAADRH
ncbi:hypothetical protein C8J56DRAFT_1026711 [Mycena floridula]|nr:hypothetical protein C8J56DRAFT_1026711 [Mycena floridula]